MLLGIKKKEIAHLVIIENILLGILAFVLAIPIGFLFSQFVSLVIVNLLGIPKTLFISLNFVSIGLLIIYFLTIYVLVLLNLLTKSNGCGIKASDLSRVFEKGFTGSNRNKANATGMGLYLSKKLCDRLGLKLDIASTEKEYTRLTITFPKGIVHNFSE